MGGFMGIGNASWKSDRNLELSGMNSLKNVFNFGMGAAQKGISAGSQALGNVAGYANKILSGNRAAAAAATAPEMARVRSESDAAKRQLAASGTARGGGVAATNQQVEQRKQAAQDQAIFAARPGAAGLLEKTGAAQTQAGIDEAAISERSADDLAKTALAARGQDFKINQSIVGDWINVAADAAFLAFG
jgi:hypothetical protein